MAGIQSSSSSSSEDLTTQIPQGPGSMDALLQRRKCELMYELKRLEHGEKPVTGTDYRGKVDKFFTKRVHLQDTAAPVANVDDVEEHRPQQVTVEVQGLLQSRSVTSLLQSQRFRRSLENTVRSHLAGANNKSTSHSPSVQQQRATPSTTVTAHERVTPPTASTNSTVPIPPPLPTAEELERLEASSDLSDRSQPETPPTVHRTEPTQPAPQPQTTAETESVLRRWNHDDFVMEISELVHRQLVSSTLHSDFGNRLERHVLRRVAESGTDGRAVQEQILRLPPSNIARNDFSHLGIPSVQDQQLDDAVSVISATASATIPYAQSNAAVQREMSAMKAQIAQLSNMLKMSLDLQMDIQRSIRQEVAAAVSQATTNNSSAGNTNTASNTQIRSRRANDSKCIVCLDDDSDAVLYRCGHICMCYACALRMKSSNGNCPVCRAPINDIVRAYRISNDQ